MNIGEEIKDWDTHKRLKSIIDFGLLHRGLRGVNLVEGILDGYVMPDYSIRVIFA